MKILALLSTLVVLSFAPVREVQWHHVDSLLNKADDTTYVVNFWATWCGPCVKEIPHFEKLAEEYRDQKVKFVYISIDSDKRLESQVQPMVERLKIKSEVWLYDNPDYDSWLPKVNKKWQGAIPATVVYNFENGYYKFNEGPYTHAELKSVIKKSLK